MKKNVAKQNDNLWGDPVETLTVVNTVQLIFYFLIKIGEWAVRLLACAGGCVLEIVRAAWFAGKTFAQIIELCLLWLWRIIDALTSSLAHALSWFIIGILWFFGAVFRITFLGAWKSIAFIFYTIPAAFVVGFYRTIRWVFKKFYDCICDIAIAAAAIPEKIYELLTQTRARMAPPRYWSGKLAGFLALLLLFTLPFPAIRSYQFLTDVRADTESAALDALNLLVDAKDALQTGNASRAKTLFADAEQKFSSAQNTVERVPGPLRFLASAIPGSGAKISNSERLLRIGFNSAHIGGRIANLLAESDPSAVVQSEFFPLLSRAFDILDDEFARIKETAGLANAIDTDAIPARYREKFSALSDELSGITALANMLHDSHEVIEKAFGSEQKRRYLLLFQNNTELRPTGGFIGSYALIDIYRGKLVNVEIPGGGSYGLQGQLSERVRAPQPLHLINPRWEFQDANWFPDFPTSAKKILWFYEKAGGPTVDGVLAINAAFFEQLISIVGPIAMVDYGKELTSENFIAETQKAVEIEYDRKENKPKQFIADLFPKVLERVGQQQKSYGAIARAIGDALVRRDIQIFLKNPAEQGKLAAFGVSGAVADAPFDYMMIVSATVGGGKSDAVISDMVTRDTVIREDGTMEGRIAFTRKHNGKRGDIFTGVQNASYLRFYLPRGTRISSATGFQAPSIARFENDSPDLREDNFLRMIEGTPALEPSTGMVVTSEFGKSVFGHWLVLEPGEEKTVELSFVLPFTVEDIASNTYSGGEYSLFIQRQSGTRIGSVAVRMNGRERVSAQFSTDVSIVFPLK